MTTLTQQHLLRYLTLRQAPLTPEARGLHDALRATSPAFLRAQLRDPRTHATHKRQLLQVALEAADYAHAPLLADLWALPTLEGLQVVDGLRLARSNGRRARTLGLRFLLGHPQIAALALARRKRTLRLLVHCLGERTWSAAARALRSPSPTGERFLREVLLRHASAPQALHALCALAKAPAATLSVTMSEPADPTARGSLTDLHLEVLRAGPPTSVQQVARLEVALDAVERSQSLIRAKVAVVLDLSASMASSGERSMHPAALGLSLTRLLEARCAQVTVFAAGGRGDYAKAAFPRPHGVADLAQGLIAAARAAPDVAFVITDGYESARQGDTALVLEGLRQLGWLRPVYQVLPRFTAKENVAQRALSAAIPVLPCEREDDLPELLARAHVASVGQREGAQPPHEPSRQPISARALERLGEILAPAGA